jgi:hypothetical protein
MISDLQEYLDAGFTEAQATVLVARDRRIADTAIQQFGLLQAAMNRGFSDTLANVQQGFAQVNQNMTDGFTQVAQRFDEVDQHLARIDEHLGRPGIN